MRPQGAYLNGYAGKAGLGTALGSILEKPSLTINKIAAQAGLIVVTGIIILRIYRNAAYLRLLRLTAVRVGVVGCALTKSSITASLLTRALNQLRMRS